jgi:hypothetical protein
MEDKKDTTKEVTKKHKMPKAPPTVPSITSIPNCTFCKQPATQCICGHEDLKK